MIFLLNLMLIAVASNPQGTLNVNLLNEFIRFTAT